jgi:hypothetical protein
MCQIVGSSQVAADEPDIACDDMFHHLLALWCDQLNANVQFGRSTHGSHRPSGLASRGVGLHRCLQNEQTGNVLCIAITATVQLFELLRLG